MMRRILACLALALLSLVAATARAELGVACDHDAGTCIPGGGPPDLGPTLAAHDASVEDVDATAAGGCSMASGAASGLPSIALVFFVVTALAGRAKKLAA